MNANDIINRVSQYDNNLAQEISRYLNSRKYGLIYEESKPEFVRLPNKTVVKGDLVNILPPRGTVKSDDSKYQDKWRVTALDKEHNKVKVMSLEKEDKTLTVNYDDLVAIARFDQPVYTGLKEVDRIEKGDNKPFNTVINGENFHALETLMYAYQGKIDCIYIDPPYNTGARDWKYNNDYVSTEDSYRHSKWLTFIGDRLKLAKKLLTSNGVLIVAIDDYEEARLKLLLEQIFPSYDINTVVIQHHPQGGANNNIARTHEYALFVTPKDKKSLFGKKEENSIDSWSLMRSGTDRRNLRIGRPKSFYAIYVRQDDHKVIGVGPSLKVDEEYSTDAPEGCVAFYPVSSDGTERVWRYTRESMIQHIKNNDIFCSKRMSLKVRKKHDIKYSPIFSVWTGSQYSASTNGTNILTNIFDGEKRFSYPKSLYTVFDCVKAAVQNNKNAIVLDFFAGSGTTAQVVNLLNSIDNGRRTCICVTNNEVSSSEEKALTQGKKLRPGDRDWEKYGIANYVTWPRIKCSILGETVSGRKLKGEYKSTQRNYRAINGFIDKSKTGKQIKKRLYEAQIKNIYPELSDRKMSDGFKENAIFFDLEYLEPSVIKSDLAFNQIAPLLWLKAGSKGRIIQHKEDYDITNEYAVLFNYKYIAHFTHELKKRSKVKTIFIVTDVNSRYQDLCHEFNDRNVYKLYESYLKSFEIQSLN